MIRDYVVSPRPTEIVKGLACLTTGAFVKKLETPMMNIERVAGYFRMDGDVYLRIEWPW